jgi:hypothetical protein
VSSTEHESVPADTQSEVDHVHVRSVVYAILAGLEERLEHAAHELVLMSVDKGAVGYDSEYERLKGKAEGIRLALSYLREIDETRISAVDPR